MSTKINGAQKAEFENQGLTVIRDPKTRAVRSINTLYDFKVGVLEKKANILASGDLKVYGNSCFQGGCEGVLTLPSGSPTIRAGNNVTIVSNDDGSIRVNADADTSSLSAEFAAVPGLVSSLSSQVSSLATTVSSFASNLGSLNTSITSLQTTVNSVQTATSNLASSFGSLDSFVTNTSSSLDSRVTQASSSLVSTISGLSSSLDSRISAVSGTLSSLSGSISSFEERISNLRGGLGVALSMNETLFGERDGLNKTFKLSHSPSPASSLMVFLNGQLLTGGNGSDFIVIGDEVSLSEYVPAPQQDDVILGMYSYEVAVKSYSINEPASVTQSVEGAYEIELNNVPSPAESLMLFMNGQLLTAGETNDYKLSGKTISLESSIADIGDSRFFATYSY